MATPGAAALTLRFGRHMGEDPGRQRDAGADDAAVGPDRRYRARPAGRAGACRGRRRAGSTAALAAGGVRAGATAVPPGPHGGNLDLSEAEYFDIIDAKTAELTACSCRLGALYSGAGENVVEQMTSYGRSLGIAFQIADDLLDLVGDEAAAGKTLGTDLREQKLTLPVIHCLNRLPRADADELRAAVETSAQGGMAARCTK